MKEAFVRSSSSRKESIRPPLVTRHSSLVTPADAEGDLRSWDDARIIREAALAAVELAGESHRIFNGKTAAELAHDNFAFVMVLVTIIKELRDALDTKGIYDDPDM